MWSRFSHSSEDNLLCFTNASHWSSFIILGTVLPMICCCSSSHTIEAKHCTMLEKHCVWAGMDDFWCLTQLCIFDSFLDEAFFLGHHRCSGCWNTSWNKLEFCLLDACNLSLLHRNDGLAVSSLSLLLPLCQMVHYNGMWLFIVTVSATIAIRNSIVQVVTVVSVTTLFFGTFYLLVMSHSLPAFVRWMWFTHLLVQYYT